MKKLESGPKGGYLFPHPITLISAYDEKGKPNAYATCWIMNIGHKPPKIALISREERYTYNLFKKDGFFGINVPSSKYVKEVDYFGTHSGKDVDKFAETGFTTFKGTKLDVPLITQCHANFECKIIDKHIIEDTMFVLFAEVVNSHFDEELINEEGKLDENKAKMMVYGINSYWGEMKNIAPVGISKEKKKE